MNTFGERAAEGTQQQLLFRTVNEQIVGIVERLGTQLGTFDLLCECADTECRGTVTVSAKEFAEICARGAFLVLPGHQQRSAARR